MCHGEVYLQIVEFSEHIRPPSRKLGSFPISHCEPAWGPISSWADDHQRILATDCGSILLSHPADVLRWRKLTLLHFVWGAIQNSFSGEVSRYYCLQCVSRRARNRELPLWAPSLAFPTIAELPDYSHTCKLPSHRLTRPQILDHAILS